MTETLDQLRQRLSETRKGYRGTAGARVIGSSAVNGYQESSATMELLEELPVRKRPQFLDHFSEYISEIGFPLETLTLADRPHVAKHAHQFITDMITEHNTARAARGEDTFRISPISKSVPTKLSKYYEMFSSSLTDHESDTMQHRREEELAKNIDIAQTYLPLEQADLKMVHGFAYMMEDFYPGPGALAARELFATYGADRARLAVVAHVQNQ